jgi:hypothetical protein
MGVVPSFLRPGTAQSGSILGLTLIPEFEAFDNHVGNQGKLVCAQKKWAVNA